MSIYDPSTAPAGELDAAEAPEPDRRAPPARPAVPVAAGRRSRSISTMATGSTIPTSTSSSTSARSRWRLLGTDAQLAEQVARIYARPLDRTRPAVGALPDPRPPERPRGGDDQDPPRGDRRDVGRGDHGRAVRPDPGGPGHAPAAGNRSDRYQAQRPEMLARGLLGLPRYPLRVIKSAPRALPNLAEVQSFAAIPGVKALGRAAAGAQRALGRDTVVGRLDLTPPRTSFNGRVSAHRRFAFGQLSLDDVKARQEPLRLHGQRRGRGDLRRRGPPLADRARRAARRAA